MLDPDITEERREQIAAEARKRIESGGSLKQDTTWGMRKLAYEIEQRTEADYRFFRFETDGGLLDDLNHNLRIADGVLRFRIFKVDPRSPAIVPPAPVGAAARRGPGRAPPAARAGRRRAGGSDSKRSAAPEAAEPAEAEAPAAPPAGRGVGARRRRAEAAAGEPETAEAADAADAAGEAPPQAGEADSEREDS